MKGNANLFLFVVLGVSALFIFIFMTVPAPEVEHINLSCPTPIINLSCPENKPIIKPIENTIIQQEKVYTSHFQEIISGCAEEREYEPIKWDCDIISKECVLRLKNAGYNCYTRNGKYNKGTEENKNYERHTWINCGNNLIIEATKGEIVHPSEYWRYV